MSELYVEVDKVNRNYLCLDLLRKGAPMSIFEEWLNESLSGEGLCGCVVWNDDKKTHVLQADGIDIGLTEPFWKEFEGKKVCIRIEVSYE